MGSPRAAPTLLTAGRLFRRRCIRCRRIRGRSVRYDDLSVVLQLIETAVGYNVRGIYAFNLSYAAVCHARRDAAHMSDIVLNDIDKGCLPILLNGGGRNQGNSLQSIHQQAGIYKLVGEERIVAVRKKRPPFYSSSGSVDLVIESQQVTACNLCLSSAVKGIDAELGVLV